MYFATWLSSCRVSTAIADNRWFSKRKDQGLLITVVNRRLHARRKRLLAVRHFDHRISRTGSLSAVQACLLTWLWVFRRPRPSWDAPTPRMTGTIPAAGSFGRETASPPPQSVNWHRPSESEDGPHQIRCPTPLPNPAPDPRVRDHPRGLECFLASDARKMRTFCFPDQERCSFRLHC